MPSRPAEWKLQDATARFSEVVRRAREEGPQTATVHGRAAVVVADVDRYEAKPRHRMVATLADFVREGRSVAKELAALGVTGTELDEAFGRPPMAISDRRDPFPNRR